MLLPPDQQELYYNQEIQLILAGHREVDSSLNGNPIKLSDCIRVRKLLAIVGDLQRVLTHLGIDPEVWREADGFWRGSILMGPEMAAKHTLLDQRIDVREDAELIASSPAPTSRGLLELGGHTITLGPQGQFWIIGYALREGKSFLRAVDLLASTAAWDGPTGIFTWSIPPAPRSFRVRGPRVFLAHERRLTAVNLIDGRHLWTAELPGSEAFPHAEALEIVNVSLGGTAGVIAIEVETDARAHTLLVFDEESGALLWQINMPDHGTRMHEIPGVGLAIHARLTESWAVVHEARTGRILCNFGVRDGQGAGHVEWLDVLGTALLLGMVVGSSAYQSPVTLLAIDPQNGQPFEVVPQTRVTTRDTMLEIDSRPVWLRWDGEHQGLLRMDAAQYPHARRIEERAERWMPILPSDNARARQRDGSIQSYMPSKAIAVGALIMIACSVYDRAPGEGPTTTLVAVDGRTSARGFELPLPATLASSSRGNSALASRGSIVVIATTGPTLSAVDVRMGRQIWQTSLTRRRSHFFLGEWLIVTNLSGFSVLRPDTGAEVASWPPPEVG
jgi:hypothetical protein